MKVEVLKPGAPTIYVTLREGDGVYGYGNVIGGPLTISEANDLIALLSKAIAEAQQ